MTHNHTFDIFGCGKSKFLSFIQNKALFFTEHRIHLDLLLFDISLPPLHNGVIILLSFFSAALLSTIAKWFGSLRARRALKKCKASVEGYLEKIGELKNQIDQMKKRGASMRGVLRSSATGAGPGDELTPT